MSLAANPPCAASATLNLDSRHVFISWEAPAAGSVTVTGYRIYYNGGNRLNNILVDNTLLQFELDPSMHALPLDDMMISIRAESAHLPSELVTVTVLSIHATTTEESSTTTVKTYYYTTEESTTPTEPAIITKPATTTEPATTTDHYGAGYYYGAIVYNY